MLTPPASLAGALQVTADCAPAGARYRVIDALMAAQDEIFEATRAGTALATVARVSISAGGANSAGIEACLSDQTRLQPILDIGEEATRIYGVTSTPSLVLNGAVIEPPPGGHTLASVSAAIVAAERARTQPVQSPQRRRP